jgi:protein-S-isoprenylcysteine O-methyltransferase Ste14
MTSALQTLPRSTPTGREAHGAPSASAPLALRRWATAAYGSLAYLLFLGTFLYLVGFVTGQVVPVSVDSGRAAGTAEALLVDGAFLALFALQHTIMARRAFKRRWTRIVPTEVERSTFVLVTCAILIAMVWQWRALPGVVWHVEGAPALALWALCALGWAMVLLSTFLIDHFELFGLRQTLTFALRHAPREPRFRERALYKLVRHPLMLGFLIAFWSTPHMSRGHLFFALMCSAYILIGLRIEERTLVAAHGDAYRDYQRRVPMLVPFARRTS